MENKSIWKYLVSFFKIMCYVEENEYKFQIFQKISLKQSSMFQMSLASSCFATPHIDTAIHYPFFSNIFTLSNEK